MMSIEVEKRSTVPNSARDKALVYTGKRKRPTTRPASVPKARISVSLTKCLARFIARTLFGYLSRTKFGELRFPFLDAI